jgi:hypothetical protein
LQGGGEAGGIAQTWWKSMGQFLIERFTVLGVEFQNWMPIVAGAAAIYILYMWEDRQDVIPASAREARSDFSV